jgi:hypothetical protein
LEIATGSGIENDLSGPWGAFFSGYHSQGDIIKGKRYVKCPKRNWGRVQIFSFPSSPKRSNRPSTGPELRRGNSNKDRFTGIGRQGKEEKFTF